MWYQMLYISRCIVDMSCIWGMNSYSRGFKLKLPGGPGPGCFLLEERGTLVVCAALAAGFSAHLERKRSGGTQLLSLRYARRSETLLGRGASHWKPWVSEHAVPLPPLV